MPRWKTTAEKEVAKYTIISKRMAEIFIKSWMERNKASREKALKRLKELGIELSKLPDDNEAKTGTVPPPLKTKI